MIFSRSGPEVNFNLVCAMSFIKNFTMKSYETQEEILFVSNSSFVKRKLRENNLTAKDRRSGAAAIDKLEEACWNGMIRKWLPGIDRNTDNEKLFLWKIFVGDAFLCAELSKGPLEIKARQSLNPYSFSSSLNNN